jgi:integrase
VIESEVERRTHVPRRTSVTIAEAGQAWIDGARDGGLERGTVKQYGEHLRLHISPLLGALKLADLSPADIDQFRSRLALSRAMTAKVMTSLSAIVAEAVAKGQVSRNVVHDAAAPSTKRHNRVQKRQEKRLEVGVDIPTKEDLRAILAAAGGRWRPLIVTAIFTGLRASELRGLTWADIDLADATLTVRQRADFENRIGDPKSGAGKRDVPLVPIVVNTLREWKFACPKGPLDLVFPNTRGNVQSHTYILYHGLGPIEQAAGLSPDRKPKYGLHAFRHAAASLFIEQGFPAKRVQTIMGHSSISMTFDLYGHLFPSPEDDRKAMAELQARLVTV